MKHLLLTTIAAVVLVGCGESQSPEPPTAKAPDILIHDAVLRGNIEAVKQHLTAGMDVDARSKQDKTPLHLAAAGGHKEIVELLIAEGANVNAKNNDGRTPLDSIYHIRGGKPETFTLLRKHGGKTGEELKAEGK
jgi:hypothetical protein